MPDSAVVNIASHLATMAREHPDIFSVIVQGPRNFDGAHLYTMVTARDIEEECNRVARGLARIGIGRGTRTVLMVTPGLEFFALTFALFKAGAVPVMVDPGMGVKNLKTCLAEAKPEAFIGTTKAHAARVILGWAKGFIKTFVTVGPRLFWGGHTYWDIRDDSVEPVLADTRAEETAAILFTSGSTGVPKGAVYTHGIFAAQVDALRDHYGIRPGECDLATFPLFALFGPALGMAAVVPFMDASRPIAADPRNLVAAIKDHQCTNLFASPALIGRIGDYAAPNGIKFPSLRRVISAGAPADVPALRQFCPLLDEGVEVFPSYGATEALPVASIGSRELLDETAAQTDEGAGVCVGRAIGGVEIAVIGITEEAIDSWAEDLRAPEGVIGEICVKGPVVTREYFERPEATVRAKIRDPRDGAVWHRMGDVGYLDARGRLWFCGRKAHRVETDSDTLYTIPCERIFNTHPKVRRTALVGMTKANKTIPVLCVELNATARRGEHGRISQELLEIGQRHEHTKSIRTVLYHPGFPMDVRHNAKIFREKLAVWAGKQLT